MAVDNFFEASHGKRKRGGVNGGSNGGQRRVNGSSSSSSNSHSHVHKGKGRAQQQQRQREDGPPSRPRRVHDEEIEESDSENDNDNDDDIDVDGAAAGEEEFESDQEADRRETPAQKRLRLAQQYLDTLKAAQEEQVGFDAADLERDLINERLQKDVLEVSGKLHLRVADKLSYEPSISATTSNRVHRLPLTCAVTSEDCKYLFTASKDGSIAKWDISNFTCSPPSTSSSTSLSSALQQSQPEASTSTSTPSAPSSSIPVSTLPAKITKLDFIPKRIPPKRRKNSDSKGKAAIARNQPSQDADTSGHTDEIYSLAISGDGTRLASGGKDRRIGVWDISSQDGNKPGEGCKWLQGLRGHKDTISSLHFRMNTNQLYTCSFDRTIKIYDILSLSYIETLFGHQDKIQDINLLRNELAITAGGRDKTIRYWKIKDETQLVFRAGGTSKIRSVLEGGLDDIENDDEEEDKKKAKPSTTPKEKKFVEGSVDCIAMVDDTHFVSGGDSGTISLWNVNKKKPIFSQPIAHGLNEYHSESEGIIGNPRWIVSLSTLPYSDLFVSGSWDGQIRFWRISEDIKSFSAIGSLPALGFVNSLQMNLIPLPGKKGKNNKTALKAKSRVLVTAALAQEHKFGRWMKLKEAKNQTLLAIVEEKA